MKNSEHTNHSRLLYTIAGRTAAAAAVFAVILSVLMIVNYLQTSSVEPLDSRAVTALMAQLDENPGDPVLKEQIRALDLLARKAYFTHLWQVRTGTLLLFCFFLILLVSLKYRSSLKAKLPDLTESRDPESAWEQMFLARKYVTAGAVGLFVLAVAAGLLTERAIEKRPSAEPAAEMSGPTDEDLRELAALHEQWPSFRGPGGLGIAVHTDVVTEWDGPAGQNIRWKTAVPREGYGSPVIWDDRIYLAGGGKDIREIYCFDAGSGEILWTGDASDVPGSPEDFPRPSGDTGYAAATMAADSVRVYAIFATGDLACWDKDGTRLWAKNVGAPDNHYGHSSSLIVYRGLLLVQYDQNTGGRLMAFDAASGDKVYDIPRDTGISWASPILVNTGSRVELILNSNPSVMSYAPLSGELLWQVDCMMGEVGPSLAYEDGMVFAVNEYALLAGIGLEPEAALVWETEDDLSEVSSPAAAGGFLIVPTSYGTVSCLNAATGERYWYEDFDHGFYASPVIAGDLVFLADMQGTFHIFKAAGEYELINSCDMGERVVATPAFMHNRIYVRGDKHLFCIGN